jgi:hypothetical protein
MGREALWARVEDRARGQGGTMSDDATQDAKDRAMLQEMLARGVPWLLAVEAIASTALDREPTEGA